MRFARRALLAAAVVWAVAADAAAQTDLVQALVGRWEGEISGRFHKNNPAVVLVIASLKEDGGRWVAEARFGTNPVSLEIDAGGKQPSLRWTSRNGTAYAVLPVRRPHAVRHRDLDARDGGKPRAQSAGQAGEEALTATFGSTDGRRPSSHPC